MSSKSLYLLMFLAAFSVLGRCEEEEEEDYSSDDIDQRVSNLRIQGAEYLQKVMKQLQDERTQAQTMDIPNVLYTQRVYDTGIEYQNYVTPVYNISGPTPVPALEAEIINKNPPPIALSKEELIALYQAAIGKVSQLQGGAKIPEVVQQVPSVPAPVVKPALQGQMGDPVSGYYYYYFPINSFLKPVPQPPQTTAVQSTTPPPQQMHATVTMLDTASNKSVEPLFMAISGFIGMALMFFFSILFVPKFKKIRSKNAQFKDTPDEMANFAQIVLEVMAGKDCSERLACEITRIFRGIKANNKPLRVLEIILPPNSAQLISLIRKSAGKKAKCGYIPCKVKKQKPPLVKPNKIKLVPWKKKKEETPHDLWMKHFEKDKWQSKKQQQQQQQQRPKNNFGNRKPHFKKP